MGPGIPLIKIQQDIATIGAKVQGKLYSNIELCVVKEVDTKNKLVSAYFFNTCKSRDRVPYCFPMYNNGSGIIFTPTKGSLGIAAWDSFREPIILSFTSPVTVTEDGFTTRDIAKLKDLNLPDLLEGEILIISSGDGFIKFSESGGILLSSALMGHLELDGDGNYELDIEDGKVSVNNVVVETYTRNYDEVFKIVKGKHTYTPTQYSQGSVELCYRMNVMKNGKEGNFFGMDTEGNIHYSGKLIQWGEGSV